MKAKAIITGVVLAAVMGAYPVLAAEDTPKAAPNASKEAEAKKPKSVAEALQGAWSGTWKVNPGKKETKCSWGEKDIPVNLVFDGEWKISGTIAQWDMSKGKKTTFDTASRTVILNLPYLGNYAMTFVGTFSPAWDSCEGTLSCMMGKGTFKLTKK